MFRLSIDFVQSVYADRFVIYQLTKRDLQNRYIGSSFGFFWHIVQPLVMLMILWFVLDKVFNAGVMANGIPFIAWLISGVIAWNFFVEALSNATNVFPEFSYLVKKLNFRVALLPLVKIASSLVIHFVFIGIAIVILLISGVGFSFFWFQSLYYLFALGVFLCGLSWLLSALNVFVRDVSYFITVALQFLYWLTPIFWRFDMLPESYHLLFKLNPLFYIVEGYRDSFVMNVPFWYHGRLTLYFWFVNLLFLLLGIFVFRKLRPHLADSL